MEVKDMKWYFQNTDGNYLMDEDDAVVYFGTLADAQYFLCNDYFVSFEDRSEVLITLEKPDFYGQPGYAEIEARQSVRELYRDACNQASQLFDILTELEDEEVMR